jgi:hypothetical protein
MERLNQGHLHPKLEVPRLTCLSQESMGGRQSSKELFEQRIPEHLHMSPRHHKHYKANWRSQLPVDQYSTYDDPVRLKTVEKAREIFFQKKHTQKNLKICQ